MPHHRRVRALLLACLLIPAAPAVADGPGVGTPTVVSLGDSYISGEAGRWAGNTNTGEAYHDALGANAYWDNASGTGEAIVRCHRSESAEVHIGGGIRSKNLACSGAETSTFFDGDDNFKPGLDFYDNGAGRQGQAKMLQTYAAANNVKMVVVSIGGNNFNFGDVVSQCVQNWLTSPAWWKDYCYDDSSVTANFTSTNVSTQTTAIKNALLRVRTAMTNAGYASSQYSILVQNYMSPIPLGSGFRYSESGWDRMELGGCEFWNADANWANNTALPTINNAVANAAAQTGLTNIRYLRLATAFNGRRLCENTVGLLEEKGLSYWWQSGAVDRTEWIDTIRTASTWGSNYFIQESIHPNYWGQLALRNCVRQAYNGGVPRSGTCNRGTGLNAYGEPNMGLS